MSDGWLSNTYLVAAEPGGDAFFVDAGGPVAPLLEKADEQGLTVTHVLLTHHHHDHVAELDKVPRRGATVVMGLIPWKEGSGGPARVFATT